MNFTLSAFALSEDLVYRYILYEAAEGPNGPNICGVLLPVTTYAGQYSMISLVTLPHG